MVKDNPPILNLFLRNGKTLQLHKFILICVFLALSFANKSWAQTPGQTPTDSAVELYINQLTDQEPENNETAVESLTQMGRTAVPTLIQKLQVGQLQERRIAAAILGEIGSAASEAVKPLADIMLNDVDDDVRLYATQALGQIGFAAREAIPQLITTLRNDKTQDVRFYAAWSLGEIDRNDPAVLQGWLKALREDRDYDVQKQAAFMLGDTLTNLPAEQSNQILTEVKTTEYHANWRVRLTGAIVLGGSGLDVLTAVSTLNQLLQSENQEIRDAAIEALFFIGDQLRRTAENLSSVEKANARQGINQTIEVLQALKHDLENSGVNVEREISNIDQCIDSLEGSVELITAIEAKDFIKQITQELEKYWVIFSLLAYIVLCLGVWSTLLWLRPLWVWRLSKALSYFESMPFVLPQLDDFKKFARYASLLVLFQYHPRVLDAWVQKNLKIARREFERKRTIKEREVYIPVPAILNGKNVANLTNQQLQPEFDSKIVCVLIWGEGGSGKTSLACEIARWAMAEQPQHRLCRHQMLPILLEQELNFEVESKQVLIEAIRGQLRDLIKDPEPIPRELLEQLLRWRRLIVVVDRFSEMSEKTRQQIRPELPDFPINALLVTSRSEEVLGGVNRTTIKPMRIAGNHLSEFMGGYLTYKGKRDLFTDQEFFAACSRLSAIAHNRDITVLLAKLYAEQLIAVKEGEMTSEIPDTFPELMLHYLNQLNQNVTEQKLANRTVHHDAKVVAWECLKQTLQPTSAYRDMVLTALGGNDAEAHLDYLEKHLCIIQTIGAAQNQIRFVLDPLAEYLASLYLIELYQDNEPLWLDLLRQVEQQGNLTSIHGFILALSDCCLSNKYKLKLPDILIKQLKQWTVRE